MRSTLKYCLVLYVLLFCSVCFGQFDTDIVLTKAEQDWLNEHPEIYVGYDSTYAPIEMADGAKHSGIAGDYINYIARQLNHPFISSYKSTWAQTYQSALDREYDMLSCLHKTTSRSEHFLFSKPYISLDTAIIMAASRAPVLHDMTMDHLDGKKVAVVAGYFWEDILAEHHPNIDIVKVKNMKDGLAEVAFGSVDAYLGILAPVTYYIDQQNISNLLVAGKTPHKIQFSVAVRNDWPELLSIINKVIDSMIMQQRVSIENRWIRLGDIHDKRNAFLLKLLSVLSLLLFASIIITWLWGKTLKKQVAKRTRQLEKLNATLEQKVLDRTNELEIVNQQLAESHRELESDNKALFNLANVDSLTSIANRRMFDNKIQDVFDQRLAAQSKLPLCLLMIDIDYFKQFNDYYGHKQGDKALELVASTLTKNLRRSSEFVARYGGEEFAIFIENCNQQQGLEIAERKRKAIEDLAFEHLNSKVSNVLTISIGMAFLDSDKTIFVDDFIHLADQALYEAKAAGRNKLAHKLVE